MKQKYLILLIFVSAHSWAQTAFEKINNDEKLIFRSQLFEEKITKYSLSKKIILLTNQNGQLFQGDFISLVKNNNLVCRALVAKIKKDYAAIKIINIYSNNLWNSLRTNMNIKILRGDDSFIKEKSSTDKSGIPDEDASDSSILTEEELFNSSLKSLSDEDKRVIKPDNILGLGYGQFESLNSDGDNSYYSHININWGYQFVDNVLAELFIGQSSLEDFPSAGISSKLTNITLRFKYIKALPLFFYILPFVGYKFISIDSPDAGIQDNSGTVDVDRENSLVSEAKEGGFVFGITLIKRLVPGWFATADLALNHYNIGFAIEF